MNCSTSIRCLLLLSVVAQLLCGCRPIVQEIQDIEITAYPDNESNVWLAKGLLYYDPKVLIQEIPGLNESNLKGLRLGWFIRDSDKKPFYRITYNLADPVVLASRDRLKAEFEKHIPEIARSCALPREQRDELDALASAWWGHAFAGEYEKCWSQFENGDASFTYEQFAERLGALRTHFGELRSKSLFYVHPYSSVAGKDKVYAILYEAGFERASYANLSTTVYGNAHDGWKLLGFTCKGR